MSLPTEILDGFGGKNKAKVTKRGQVVTSPLEFDEVSNQTFDVAGTAYNFYAPKANKQFVITSILLYANKNVGAGDATVTIYEASADDTATVDKTLFTAEMVKQTSRDFIGLNILVSEGVWINGKTDDDDVFSTITGYYVEV